MANAKKTTTKKAEEPTTPPEETGEDSEPDTTGDAASADSVRAAEEQANQDVREGIANEQKAVEENPDHPEEAVETRYLVGGEVPANAPGTEGLPRE